MCDIVPQNKAFVPAIAAAALGAALLTSAARADLRPEAVPGGVAEIHVAAAASPRPEVRFDGRPVLLRQRADGWHAVVGLPLDTPVGEQAIQVGPEGNSRPQSFAVGPKAYPEQRLTIKNPKLVTPPPEELARIAEERERQLAIRSRFRDVPVNRVDLDLPADGRLSSRFGLRRFFNGEARAPHAGLDVAIPRGTPVKSTARGTVLAVDDYFFNGKTVFVDHGNGLISMVCHLDRIDVQAGDPVSQGQRIGLSGMTGRASGPHLHWSMVLNGVMVDPALFIERAP